MVSTFSSILDQINSNVPRPGLHPIPGSAPLTVSAAILPPLIYYAALLLLAPFPPPAVPSVPLVLLRNALACIAAVLFLRLPLAYHVNQSIGLTYQLGLVGIYGACRVVDAFFISPHLFNHIPRRVRYEFSLRHDAHPHLGSDEKEWTDGGVNDPFLLPDEPDGEPSTSSNSQVKEDKPTGEYVSVPGRRLSVVQQAHVYLSKTMSGPHPLPVYESARTEEAWPSGWLDRASWALELELSMRGTGFTWTTTDVRHTRNTWLPTIHNRLHSLFFHTLPVLVVCWAVIKAIYVRRLQAFERLSWQERHKDLLHQVPLDEQMLLTAALGAFLMTAFSVEHSLFAMLLHPFSPSPLAFFPPLYTFRVWHVTSVRKFWSYGWHRLFARLFLVYGVWPGEWLERKIMRKSPDQSADVGKVLGAFASSALVHSFSVRGVLGGEWRLAAGEAKFFGLNGLAIVVEGAVIRIVKKVRKQRDWPGKMWYDSWIGRVWWGSVLLWSGRNFARGWITAGLVREMAFM